MDTTFLDRRTFVTAALGGIALGRWRDDRLTVRPRRRHTASGTEEYSETITGGEVIVGPDAEIVI